MIFSWGPNRYPDGSSYHVEGFATIIRKATHLLITRPINTFQAFARSRVGNKLRIDRIFNLPTNVFEVRTQVLATSWTVDCHCEVLWSIIGTWTITEVDNQYWSPQGFMWFPEYDNIVWTVRYNAVHGWEINEVDTEVWTPSIKATNENCITGDGEIDTTTTVLLPQMW